MNIGDLLGRVSEGIQGIKVKSIIDTPIKAFLVLTLLAIVAAIFKVATWVLIILFSITGVLFFFIVAVFGYFCVKNPPKVFN